MTSIITDNGKNVILNRAYKTTPTYTPPTKFKVGINQTTPTGLTTVLDYPVPILDGTVNDDGDNQLIGSSGGDNSTDNTTTYKPGAGVTDNTAQNLIANDTSVTKIWTISNLATLGNVAVATEYAGLWLYIKDTTTLDKFENIGVSGKIKLGSDSSNYYYITFTDNSLSVGWNWITDSGILSTWTETGTVAGVIDTFIIEITTNNATDEFAAGDVVYDLLRQWDDDDATKTIETDYPTFDEVNQRVTIRCKLLSTQANGFDINALSLQNTDGTAKVTDVDTFNDESKSDTDEIIFTLKNGF